MVILDRGLYEKQVLSRLSNTKVYLKLINDPTTQFCHSLDLLLQEGVRLGILITN